MKPAILYCIHGFLGRPSDWDFLEAPKGVELRKIDVFATSKNETMAEWASRFNSEVSRDGAENRVLLGYSMGGRLALHAAIRNPSLFSAAVIVSSHPGLPEGEREARVESDEAWAARFETEAWESLVHEWENLPAFCARANPFERLETDYDRAALASALRLWSLGRQEDLSSRIKNLDMPILWVAGEADARYVASARLLSSMNRRFGLWTAPSVGHRVPWEASSDFQRQLWGFLRENLLNA